MSITRDEWLVALREADPQIDEQAALTTQEFGTIAKLKTTQAKVKLKRLVQAGLARATTKRIIDITGRAQVVTAYQLVKK